MRGRKGREGSFVPPLSKFLATPLPGHETADPRCCAMQVNVKVKSAMLHKSVGGCSSPSSRP